MFRFVFAAALLASFPALADTYGYGGPNPYQGSRGIDAGRTWSTDHSQPEAQDEPEENPYGGRYVDDQDEDDTYETYKTYRDPSGADIHTDGSGIVVPND